MSVVTPLLKSAEWAEQATQRGLLFSPLNTAFASVPAMAPAIAYAIDQGETVAFVPATGFVAQIKFLAEKYRNSEKYCVTIEARIFR